MPDELQQQSTGVDPTASGSPQPMKEGRIEDLPEWAQKVIRDTREEAAQRRVELKRVQDAAQQKLIEEGNFKAVADQRAAELAALQPYKERAEALDKIIRDSNSKRIATVAESMRPLIPVDDLAPEALSRWLDTNWALLTTPRAPNIDAGAGAGTGGKTSPALSPEEVDIARAAGMTPEQYAAQKAKRAAR